VVADRAGFEVFYRERLPGVVRACALVTLDPAAAEEIAAEAFLRVWSRWGKMQNQDHAGGYVFKTAMRLCAKRRYRARRELVRAVPDRPGVDEAGRSITKHEVFEALSGLPLRQRQAVVLRDWAGYPTNEVAGMIGMRESTVRVHLARGRRELRRILSVEERDG
jgi:RNA polymerase sigma-70 factor (ECF subfamily)